MVRPFAPGRSPEGHGTRVMQTPFRLSIVAIASAFLTGTASAGPMDWTYTSRLHAAGPGDIPYIFIADGGTGVGGSYMLGATLQGLIANGYPSNPGVGGPIAVGYFGINQLNAAWQSPPTFEKHFQLDMILTDSTSGQTGTVQFFGSGNTVVTQELSPNPIWVELSSPTSRSIVIGANRYNVEVSPGGQADWRENGAILAKVDVQPAATPEPSTLGLAAVGLMGLIRFRLTRASTSRAVRG